MPRRLKQSPRPLPQPDLKKRPYPSETKTLPPELKGESVNLGPFDLRIFYVDLAPDPYWTWAIGRTTGGHFTSKSEAKWDAALRGYEMMASVVKAMGPAYTKAKERNEGKPKD